MAVEDVLPIVEAHIKGQRITKVLVDGGAQICVMSEKTMHRLGLEVSGSSDFKAKMANNVFVKCLGVINNVKIFVCGVQVAVDIYVMPAKGEGYPVILGRPWLIAMNARQDLEKGILVLKPQQKDGKTGKPIVYNMKEGKLQSLGMETTKDEWSTEESTSTTLEYDSASESDSTLEVMGIVLGESKLRGETTKQELSDERIERMLSSELTKGEKEEFKVMLKRHNSLFISDHE